MFYASMHACMVADCSAPNLLEVELKQAYGITELSRKNLELKLSL